MMPRMRAVFLLVPFLALGHASSAFGQATVVFVRHAERVDNATAGPAMTANDPELSAEGRRRAESLAKVMKDSKIRAIYTTEYKRTKQTAAPLATMLSVNPIVVGAKDINGLVERLKSATGNVLVIGHSNTIPDIIRALGVSDPVAIQESEFDNLFVVSGGSVLRLRY